MNEARKIPCLVSWRSGHTPRRQLGRTLLLVAVIVGTLAGCQTENGLQKNGTGTVAFTDFSGYIDLVTRQRDQDQDPRGSGTSSDFEEEIYQERLYLETKGYIYHPNLVDITAGGLFGLLQHRFEDVTAGIKQDDSDNGKTLEFDVSADILKEKNYPTMVYARRYESFEPRPFFTSEQRITSEYGLLWRYLSETMPTSLQVSNRDVDYDPLSDTGNDRRQGDDLIRFETGYNFSDYNTLSFDYEHQSVEEDPFDVDYDVDQYRLAHQLMFGADEQHRLDSELTYYDQDGSFNLERTQFREALNLKHSDTLRSWYQLELADRSQESVSGAPTIDDDSSYLEGTLEHRLYESLISRVGGFIDNQDFKHGSDIDRYGVHGDLNYQKKNSWGVLLAQYRLELQETERGGGDQIISIIDESHTFNDPFPVILNSPDIILDSIVITNLAGTQVYQLNLDYTILSFANRVEINRVPTGMISDGETVLIDYQIASAGDYTLDSTNQRFGIRQNFAFGLSPYYRLEWQNQSISEESTSSTVPEDITSHIIGMEYLLDTFRARAEYENHNSTTVPYDSYRVNGSYSHRFGFGATGSVGASWLKLSYDPPNDRETKYVTLDGRYRHPLSQHLTVEGVVRYLKDKDSASGDDEGVDADFSLEWDYRQTEVRLVYEIGRYKDDFARDESSMLYVQVKRSF